MQKKSKKKIATNNRRPGQKYKSTRLEVERRIQLILDLYFQGKDIVPNSSGLDITDRQLRKYKAAALKRLQRANVKDIEQKKLIAIQRREKLLHKCNDKDVRSKLVILQDIAKLEGLYVDKVESENKQRITLYTSEQMNSEYLKFENELKEKLNGRRNQKVVSRSSKGKSRKEDRTCRNNSRA